MYVVLQKLDKIYETTPVPPKASKKVLGCKFIIIFEIKFA